MHLQTTNYQPQTKRGFTLIELLVMLAVMGAIVTFAEPMLSSFMFSQDASTSAAGAVDALRQAQSATMAGKSPGRWGVHFETNRYVLFQGAAYSAGAPENLTHELSAGVTVTGISLSGGGSDVHFADHRGVPTEAGTVTFTAATGKTNTVTVGAAGMFDSN